MKGLINSALAEWRKEDEEKKAGGVNTSTRDLSQKTQIDHADIVPGQRYTHPPTAAEVFELFVLHGRGKAQTEQDA